MTIAPPSNATSSPNMRGAIASVKQIDIGNAYLIFVSGIQPPKNENHRVVTDDVAEQTKLVFAEIEKLLAAVGATLDHVVKAVIYLTDIGDFAVVSPIRDQLFQKSKPVSTLAQISRLTRDGAKIEIEVTAVLPK